MFAAPGSNAEVRAAVLARVDERLHGVFPDGRPSAAVSSFDDLEAAAAVTGDAVARELMEQILRSVLALPEASPPERCPTCETKLRHVEMPKEVAAIRGLLAASRVWCHCPTQSVGPTSDADASGRKCRKGFSPGDEGGPRRGIRIWDAATGRDLCFLKDQGGEADAVAWSRDAARVATQQFEVYGSASLWDVETGRRLRTIGSEPGTYRPVAAFCYGAGGPRILFSDGLRVYVVDAEAERRLCDLERPFGELHDIRFSPDGAKLAASGWHFAGNVPGPHHVAWWDAESGHRLGEAQQLPCGGGLTTFSSDSRRLLTTDLKSVFRIHDADTGSLLTWIELPGGDERTRVLASADGTCLAYYEGSWFGRDMLWLRRRPEWWWGVFRLPELYVVAALGAALIWSLWRDVRAWRSRASAQPSPDV